MEGTAHLYMLQFYYTKTNVRFLETHQTGQTSAPTLKIWAIPDQHLFQCLPVPCCFYSFGPTSKRKGAAVISSLYKWNAQTEQCTNERGKQKLKCKHLQSVPHRLQSSKRLRLFFSHSQHKTWNLRLWGCQCQSFMHRYEGLSSFGADIDDQCHKASLHLILGPVPARGGTPMWGVAGSFRA